MSVFDKNSINRFFGWAISHRWFLALVTTGLLLRLAFGFFHGLSNDELSAWHRAIGVSWNELWYTGIQQGDMHPGLYQVLLWGWIQLFGDCEWSLRLPSYLFFIANASLLYLIGTRFLSQTATWFYLILYCLLFFPVMHTVFARPYNSGTFFILLLVYQSLRFRAQEARFLWANAWIVVGFLGAMLSHYFAFLVAGLYGISFFLLLPRRKWFPWLLLGIASIVTFLPHASVTWHHLNAGGLGWVDKPTPNWFSDFFFLFLNNDWFLTGVLLAIVGSGLLRLRGTPESRFFLLFSLATGLISFLISIYFTPITRDVAMLFVLPFLFWGISPVLERKPLSTSQAGILLSLYALGSTLFMVDFAKPVHFGVFRELGSNARKLFDTIPPDSVEVITSSMNVDYLNYYYPFRLKETIAPWGAADNVAQIEEQILRSNKPYVLMQWTNSYFVPQFLEVIRSHYPGVAAGSRYFNSGFYLFSKQAKSMPRSLVRKRLPATNLFADHTVSSEEFVGHIYLDPNHQTNSSHYFLVSLALDTALTQDLHVVAVLERNGQMLLSEQQTPAYYFAQNIRELKNVRHEAFLAFPLPKDHLPGDKIHVYLWNPAKQTISFDRPSVFEVVP